MRLLLSVLLGLCLLNNTSQAAGVLRISLSEMTLGGPDRVGKLMVKNTGDSPLYLDITQEQVQTPLTDPEVRVPVGDVAAPSLLISPMRLALGPQQEREINVKELRKPAQRKIWRVTFRPRENISVQGVTTENTLVPLAVSIGYGVVIYQLGASVGNK